jgi:DNA topoisomerase VI subunit B
MAQNMRQSMEAEKKKAKVIKERLTTIFDKVANLLEKHHLELTKDEINLLMKFNLSLLQILTVNRKAD